MNKLKPILAGIKRNLFWILSGVVALVALYGWYEASESLAPSFEENKKAVNQLFTEMSKVKQRARAKKSWPEYGSKALASLHTQFSKIGGQVQQFQTPERMWPAALSDEFRTAASRKGRSGSWSAELMAEYKKIVPDEVKGLRKIIDAADESDAPGVQWDAKSFEQFADQFKLTPITADAMFEAQEKLWVAQDVLKALASANKDATDRFNLPVSAIEVFQVGAIAAKERSMWTIDTGVPAPAPAAPPAPAAGPAVPGAKKPPVPAPAPAVSKQAAPVVKQIPGARIYPIRIRARMDVAALPQVLGTFTNQRLMIVIEDVHFENKVSLIQKERPQPPAAPAGMMPGGPAGMPGAQGVGGFGAPAVAAPPENAAPAGPPQLVQVPRGTVVEIQATAYIVYTADIDAIKVASRD